MFGSNPESRGTGLKQNKPPGWETGSHINFKEVGPYGAEQGPEKGPHPTSRGMQAPIPGEIGTQLDQAPGGFLGQIIMGRPGMANQRERPGDSSNVIKAGPGMVGAFPAAGSGSGGGMTTKPGVMGRTADNPHIGSTKGGF